MFKSIRIQNLACALVILIFLGPKIALGAKISQNKGTDLPAELLQMKLEQLKAELAFYQNDHSISGQFTQNKLIKELNLNLKSEGTFRVVQQKNKPAFIVWNILKPDTLNVCISGLDLFIKTKNKNKSEIVQQNLSDIESSDPTGIAKLHSLMVIDTEALFKKFNILKSNNTIVLKNKDTQDSIGEIRFALNKEKLIQSVEVTEASGDILKIQFLKIKKEKLVQSTNNEFKCDEILKK